MKKILMLLAVAGCFSLTTISCGGGAAAGGDAHGEHDAAGGDAHGDAHGDHDGHGEDHGGDGHGH